MLFIEYLKCSTCQKAKKWLEEHNITYTDRHIVEDNPTYEELKEWQSRSGLPLKIPGSRMEGKINLVQGGRI